MKVLVIGGTQFIGKPLVHALVKAGHDVTIMHRKRTHTLGKKVANIVCDRNDADAVSKAIAPHRFEVIYDNVYDWERGTTANQVEAAVRAAGDRLIRYVFMSSVAAYGDGLNHHEADALAPDDHPDAYVRNKAMTERMLFRLYHRKDGRVVKEGDDLMAATRYALMMLRHARTAAAHDTFRRAIVMPNLSVA